MPDDPTEPPKKYISAAAAFAFILTTLTVLGLVYTFAAKDLTLLNRLAEPEFSRGFITLIVAIGTLGIALMLTFAALFGETSADKERFERGKEVLMVMVGILGTIVGYYYGVESTKLQDAPPATQTAVKKISQNDPASGK